MSKDVSESPAERRRARLRFRAQRRGFKEVDLIFGAFAQDFLPGLSERELDLFEALLDVPDQEIYGWLQGQAPVPPEYDTDVYARLKSVCTRTNPKWNV